MIYIGIDPGVKGGISIIKERGDGILEVTPYPIPVTEADTVAIFNKQHNAKHARRCIIEHVHAFPRQGVVSMFTFGKNYGFLRGILVSLQIPFEEVTPVKWQGHFGLKRKPEETKGMYKKRILQKAQNLFPYNSVALQTADSLMIAEYLRQKENKR